VLGAVLGGVHVDRHAAHRILRHVPIGGHRGRSPATALMLATGVAGMAALVLIAGRRLPPAQGWLSRR
jgi:hypothetical protein